MKIGTIVKVVDNSLAAPDCTIGAYGVVMPEELWWGDASMGDVAVLFCYNSDASPDLHYVPWLFDEEDLHPVSGSEDLSKYLFERMNGSYIRLSLGYENLFQGAPEELSFPSWEGVEEEVVEVSVEDQLNSLISEYKQQVECYLREYLNLAEESSDKTAEEALDKAVRMRKRSEEMVLKLKELKRSLR